MKNKQGFTLVELIVTICIIGLLTVIIAPQVTGYIASAKEVTCKSNQKELQEKIILATHTDETLDNFLTLNYNKLKDLSLLQEKLGEDFSNLCPEGGDYQLIYLNHYPYLRCSKHDDNFAIPNSTGLVSAEYQVNGETKTREYLIMSTSEDDIKSRMKDGTIEDFKAIRLGEVVTDGNKSYVITGYKRTFVDPSLEFDELLNNYEYQEINDQTIVYDSEVFARYSKKRDAFLVMDHATNVFYLRPDGTLYFRRSGNAGYNRQRNISRQDLETDEEVVKITNQFVTTTE